MRMYLLTLHCILFAIYFFLPGVRPLRWLGLKKPASGRWNKTVCQEYHQSKVLNQRQYEMCKKRLSFMKYIAEAVEMTISECLKQAKYERWDCKAILKYPKFSPDIRGGTKESGFLHALSSAALVFTITRGCTKDPLNKCYCGKKPEKRHLREKTDKPWKWADCHDNIAYGMKFSKDFLDTIEVSRFKKQPDNPDRILMNLHNNNAGRKAVRDSLKEDYQCANPLIKCQILTCTRQLPNNVSDIAKKLFKRYKKARHVQLEKKNDSSSRRLVPKSKKRKNKGRSRRKHKRTDTREIVYLTKSRNFCVKDERRQLPGTEGRECGRKELNDDKSTARTRTCNYLCCDRGTVTNTTSWVDNRYKCKFSFKIMDVICKTRLVRREVVTCR